MFPKHIVQGHDHIRHPHPKAYLFPTIHVSSLFHNNNQQIANLAKDFTGGIDFLEGSKHADYKSGDKVAALGVGGLVAGTLGVKALAKVGFLAKITPFLINFSLCTIA